ncbi:hypothetical protein ACQKIE_16020 [Luteibacter sp. NPDC031894]|uniref:SGNH/GDSL hydrolase family protein n=1 Tax=Luteibacter sp. NPDC031894 TaxID=3390572 RepID=UPI003D00446A
MPVTTTKSSRTFQGNGVTQLFDCDFRIFAATDVVVSLVDQIAGTSVPLVLNSDYSISGANDDDGFTVTTFAPVSGGKNLLVKRILPYTQPTSFKNQAGFFPTLHQDMADRLEMQIQQISDQQSRVLTLPDGTFPPASGELPVPQAGSLVGWNESGTAIVNLGPTGVGAGQLTDVNINSNAGINASKLSFVGGFAGALTRTVLAKLRNLRVNAEDYGNVTQAATAANTVQVTAAVNGIGASLTNPAVADATFRGEGSLTGVYRKAVVPENAASDCFVDQGVIAGKHLKRFNQTAKPVVVLVGDSISTYFANSIARSDLLVETLRDTLNQQMPNGVTFYDRSVAGMTLGSVFGSSLSGIPWAVTPGKAWIDYVKDLAPDLVIFSFGMNDSTAVKVNEYINTMSYVNGWAKIPSVVFCTNLVPNPASTAFPEGEAGNEGRDMAAGLTRSFAKYNGLGLLDFHRKVCMVRDGFDPASSIMTRGDTVLAVSNGSGGASITGTKLCRDFKVRINMTAANLSATNYITVNYGNGVNDFVQILRPTSTTLQCAFFCGGSDSAAITTQTFTFNPPGGSYIALTIEVSNDVMRIYYDADGSIGQYNDPYLTQPIVRLGGQFTPKVISNVQTILTAADFSYGEYRTNVPSVKNSLLWGDGSSSIDVHGGSGWNHPGGFAASHVYRPLVRMTRWCAPVPIFGQLSVASTGTSFTQTLPTPELDTTYEIIGSWEGSAAPAWAVLSKTTTSFTITLAAAAGASIKLNWQLLRK